MIKHIYCPEAAPPPKSSRYAHATEYQQTLYITGQLPIDPDAPDNPLPLGIREQTELVFRNLQLIATAAGYSLSHTLFVRAYLLEFERDFEGFNDIYFRYYANPAALPGRTTVGVARLGRGALVEVDLIVARSS